MKYTDWSLMVFIAIQMHNAVVYADFLKIFDLLSDVVKCNPIYAIVIRVNEERKLTTDIFKQCNYGCPLREVIWSLDCKNVQLVNLSCDDDNLYTEIQIDFNKFDDPEFLRIKCVINCNHIMNNTNYEGDFYNVFKLMIKNLYLNGLNILSANSYFYPSFCRPELYIEGMGYFVRTGEDEHQNSRNAFLAELTNNDRDNSILLLLSNFNCIKFRPDIFSFLIEVLSDDYVEVNANQENIFFRISDNEKFKIIELMDTDEYVIIYNELLKLGLVNKFKPIHFHEN
jgi:hypothetical protein